MQSHQPDAAIAVPLFPGLARDGDQVRFIQPRPDILLRRLLKIGEFEFDTLTGHLQIGTHAG